jgi:sugar phosphate isomerase/epimerase
LGIVSDELHLDFTRAVEQAATCGIRSFDLRMLRSGRVPHCSAAELREVESIVHNEDLAITALSPGLFKHVPTYQDFRLEMCELFPAAAELAARWQVGALLVFGFEKTGGPSNENSPSAAAEYRQECAAWLAEAAAAASEYGLTLLLEPEPICWADTGAHAAEMIRASGATNLFLNYDPGNSAWQQRKDPADEVPKVLDLVRHLHVKDIVAVATAGQPVWVEPGRGMISYGALFGAFKQSGYDGPIVLEPHLPLSPAMLSRYVSAVGRLWKNAPHCSPAMTDY